MPSKNVESESAEETLDEKVDRLWAEHEAAVNVTIDRYCSVPENKAR